MSIVEAIMINSYRKHCEKNALAGLLWYYEKMFIKAKKVLKRYAKKMGRNGQQSI